jgi:hypothetical protein
MMLNNQIPSTKSQINPNYENWKLKTNGFGHLNLGFEICLELGIWDLGFKMMRAV